jgi:DNA repair photolyase
VIEQEIKCKSLLNKSRLEDYCINPYVGCQHACTYCYADSYTQKFSKHPESWGDFVDIKINAPTVLEREIGRKTKGTIFFSSLTDAYQPIERKYELTRRLLGIVLEHQFPLSIQTKSALVLRDLDLFRKLDRCEVGFTVTTLDDDLRRLFEPYSSSIEERISAIKKLKENGVRTFVFFGPVLPYISDQNLEHYFQRIAGAGTDYVYVDKLNPKPGLWPKLEKLLRSNFPGLCDQWQDILIGRSDYYQRLKVKADVICRDLGLECRFCS